MLALRRRADKKSSAGEGLLEQYPLRGLPVRMPGNMAANAAKNHVAIIERPCCAVSVYPC